MKYNITFKNYFKKFGIFSIVIFLTSLLLIIFKGLNYGIDFKGELLKCKLKIIIQILFKR